jgi:hypothetical protein
MKRFIKVSRFCSLLTKEKILQGYDQKVEAASAWRQTGVCRHLKNGLAVGIGLDMA